MRAGVEAILAGPPPWPGLSEPRLAEALPGMPPIPVQETFTGRSGDDTLAEGFAAGYPSH